MSFTIALLLTYFIEPEIVVSSENEVKVIWKTENPSTNSNVYYSPIPDSLPTVDFLFDFLYNHWDNKKIDTIHTFILKKVIPGLTYIYRVKSIDTKTHRTLSSSEETFRIIERNGKKIVGISIRRGPHLALVDTSSIVIFWETNFPSKGWVIYGEGELSKKTLPDSGTYHEIRVSGLKGNTHYYYKVVSAATNDTVLSPLFMFKTAPPRGENISFAVLGDSRNNWKHPNPDFRLNGVNVSILRRLLWKAYQQKVQFIVFVGDLIQGYTDDTAYVKKQYDTWLWSSWPTSAYIPVYPAMGNHDATAPLKRVGRREYIDPDPPLSAENFWSRFFVLPQNGPSTDGPPYLENVYSFDYGDFHLVILNSDYKYGKIEDTYLSKRIDKAQREWLIKDLKKKMGFTKFIFFHEPAFPVSGNLGSSLDFYREERDSVWEIFVKFKIQTVFCGHEHIYARLLVDEKLDKRWKIPIRQIITGRAGAPSYELAPDIPYKKNLEKFSTYNHFIIVKKEKNEILYHTITITGDTIDSWVETQR